MLLSFSPFLSVCAGDFVIVSFGGPLHSSEFPNWWLGYVLCVIASARDPSVNSLFQIVDVDTGSVRIVNADLVLAVLHSEAN